MGKLSVSQALRFLYILTFNPHINPMRWILLLPSLPPKLHLGLPRWLSGKELACQVGYAGDVGLNPGSGRSSGGGNGNPLQYSYLESPMDRGAWWATVHRFAKNQAQLND